jgi:hypothetical protein
MLQQQERPAEVESQQTDVQHEIAVTKKLERVCRKPYRYQHTPKRLHLVKIGFQTNQIKKRQKKLKHFDAELATLYERFTELRNKIMEAEAERFRYLKSKEADKKELNDKKTDVRMKAGITEVLADERNDRIASERNKLRAKHKSVYGAHDLSIDVDEEEDEDVEVENEFNGANILL